MKSKYFRHLCSKKIHQFSNQYCKTRENLPNEEVTWFAESEVKNLTKELTNFRDQCLKDGLSIKELEEESMNFITDK